MQYRLLGNSGLLVSRMAFGTMTLGIEAKSGSILQKVDLDHAARLIGEAIDLGINYFDTADMYTGGEAEIVLGKALKDRRQDVVISTKVGVRSGAPLTQSGLSRRHIMASIDDSLRRLNTDWTDIYIAHREDRYTPLEETLEALNDVVRSGKARYLGYSNWSAWKVAAAIEMQKANGWAQFTHGQVYYSLIGRDVEADIVPMAQNYGLGLTIWSPLAFGFLTGKFDMDTIRGPESRFSDGLFASFLPIDYEAGFALIETVRRIAREHDATVPQVALAWLLSRSAVSSILLGTTKAQQLRDNVAAIDLALTPESLAELDAMASTPKLYPNWFHETGDDMLVRQALEPRGNGA
ncbi:MULTISPECIES: aldo/keto reductase [Sphingobium]|uniref:Aldo/keto reductase n=1 Tax=Sphingobium chungbukense TaxID=56193 RepID=A0A0M3AUW7_9SPHN|nr:MULTISPECIES: aldo/keto reductase [Sphingobium]KKW94007.1 aldo/keto reductase [Sphingobium chungbukense]PJG48427.1 aldo/keto reductase [Sphingobium sp. LB126]